MWILTIFILGSIAPIETSHISYVSCLEASAQLEITPYIESVACIKYEK